MFLDGCPLHSLDPSRVFKCLNSLVIGDALGKLRKDYGWDLSVEEIDRDRVDEVRKFIVEAQSWRLMGLVEKINHVCADGNRMSAQSMLDVCKAEIIKLRDEYPDIIIGDLK